MKSIIIFIYKKTFKKNDIKNNIIIKTNIQGNLIENKKEQEQKK